MKRSTGFYWVKVKYEQPWVVAYHYGGGDWEMIGEAGIFEEIIFSKIGPRLTPPQET